MAGWQGCLTLLRRAEGRVSGEKKEDRRAWPDIGRRGRQETKDRANGRVDLWRKREKAWHGRGTEGGRRRV